MVVEFESGRRCVTRAVEALRLALELNEARPEDNVPRRAAFARGMESLVGVQVAIARGEVVPDAEIDEFRHGVTQLVRANTRGLFPYVFGSLTAAICSIDDGWYDACLRRSALQLFHDDYPGARELFDADPDISESFTETDEWLHDRALYVEPLPEHQIPPGLPAHHWWWRLPGHLPGT